jgi:hypothetical protein
MTTITRRNPLERAAEVTLASDDGLAIVLAYDYSQIADEHRGQVISAARRIKTKEERAKQDLIAIGNELAMVKERLGHGQFQEWITVEFDMSYRTANRWMNAAKVWNGKSDTVSLLSDSAMIELSGPSVPESARVEAIAEAQATGTSPTKARAKEIVAAHQPPPVVDVAPSPLPTVTAAQNAPRTHQTAQDAPVGATVLDTMAKPEIQANVAESKGRKSSPVVDEPDIRGMIDDTERLAGQYAEAEEWFKHTRRAAIADHLCALRHAMYEAIRMMEGE